MQQQEAAMVKAGDVVVLKSGGQAMTVVDTRNDNAVCVWMGEEGDLFRDTLPVLALELVEEEDGDRDDEDEEDGEEHDDEEHDEDDADHEDDKSGKDKAA